MNYKNSNRKGNSFPDPLADVSKKESQAYGLQYAKAIESQWGKSTEANSLFEERQLFLKKIETTPMAFKILTFIRSFFVHLILVMVMVAFLILIILLFLFFLSLLE